MKTLIYSILCIILLSFFGCQDKSDPPTMSVERYIDLLKAGKYDYSELPLFTSKDIPSLLVYRNENPMISNFPTNRISSAWTPDIALGMYVLWTIESIRARAIGSEYLIGTFPSQNPVVEKRVDLEVIEQSNEVRSTVATTYFEWWETNKDKEFDEFNKIDPLKITEFRWH